MTRTGLDRIWTVPNVISFIRLLFVPVFLWLLVTGQDGPALAVLIIATASDFVDGFIARNFDQVTTLGALLDPVSDRLFIAASVIGLAIRDMLPLPLVVAIMARDVFLLAVVLTRGIAIRSLPRVNYVGKTATFVLFVAFPVIVLSNIFVTAAIPLAIIGWILGASGAVLYWLAGLTYLGPLLRAPGRRDRLRNRLG